MRRLGTVILASVAFLRLSSPVTATVLLDQTSWSSSTLTNQNLPTRSGWFYSFNRFPDGFGQCPEDDRRQ